VYPRVRWQGQVGRLLQLAQRHELGRSPLRSAGLGRETYALREYRQGDPPGRIHWKATARHGRLISREEVVTKSQDPVTIQAKLQEYELAQAVEQSGGKGKNQ